jgi:hypothetical protein
VRADVEPWSYPGVGELGTLVVAEVRGPVGNEAAGAFYRVRDLGIRCIRAPCFSYRAVRVNGTGRIPVSGFDLHLAGAMPPEEERALQELTSKSGLFVLGRLARTRDGGRTLSASRLYLKEPPPRA